MNQDLAVMDLDLRLAKATDGTEIPVPISYDIIRLFSEGLYRSPQKAVEELVANSFDAGAELVSVMLPTRETDGYLWVVDDGCGMDEDGFHQLWRVADSPKAGGEDQNGRSPIGQFGIGKLAAYVLAWRLTHISKSKDGLFRYASMDFRKVTGSLNEPDAEPVKVYLHEISEAQARTLLGRIESTDPPMWDRLFGPGAAPTWTAAALADFRELMEKLHPGTLGWVLRTGLPLVSNFTIHLNGQELVPSKAEGDVLYEITIGGNNDRPARELNLTIAHGGIEIPGIPGTIRGTARIFKSSLTTGKSSGMGRSNGFFVRIRGRVINLDDELFGLPVVNLAAWSRFSMEIAVDGLREHLLSSREGVRESDLVDRLREYMHRCFNACRVEYDRHAEATTADIERDSILDKNPSPFVVGPLLEAIRTDILDSHESSYYIQRPDIAGGDTDVWLQEAASRLRERAFAGFELTNAEAHGQLCSYDPATGIMSMNRDHPFAARIIFHAKNNTPARLITASEIVTYALFRNSGLPGYAVYDIFQQREQILRRLAGEKPLDIPSVMRHLKVANADETAMERAVGHSFEIMGFDYEPAGGSSGGPDGILRARLGRGQQGSRDFAIVYDTKTSSEAIPADKVDVQALVTFAKDAGAQYSLVVGHRFENGNNPEGVLNKRIRSAAEQDNHVIALLTSDLIRLVSLHYRYGLTFAELQKLFDNAHTVPETHAWVGQMEENLQSGDEIPLGELLHALEAEQADDQSPPQLNAARTKNDVLMKHAPDRLLGALEAVQALLGERWLSVDKSGYVRMEQSAAAIREEFQRRLADTLHSEFTAPE